MLQKRETVVVINKKKIQNLRANTRERTNRENARARVSR